MVPNKTEILQFIIAQLSEMPFSADQLDQLQRVCIGEPEVLAVFLFGSQVNGLPNLFGRHPQQVEDSIIEQG